MRGVDSDLPKEMRVLAGKPLIQHAIEEGMAAGIHEIVVILNRNKESIRRYLEEEGSRAGSAPQARESMARVDAACSIHFVYQPSPTGEGDALLLAAEAVGGRPLAVVYPDNLHWPCGQAMSRLRQVFDERRQDVVGLAEIRPENAVGFSDTGRVELSPLGADLYSIDKLSPKGRDHGSSPGVGQLRTCGFYVAGSRFFEYLARSERDSRGERTDGPATAELVREGRVLGCRLPGIVFDVGNPAGYASCLRYLNE